MNSPGASGRHRVHARAMSSSLIQREGSLKSREACAASAVALSTILLLIVARLDRSGPHSQEFRENDDQTHLKSCSVAGLVLFLVVGLASPNFQPRSGFGWEIDHFVGYFVLTLIFCRAWPRRLGVAGGLIAFALLLEGLQALPPDRSSNLLAAFYSAGGVLTATLFAELFIRARRRSQPKYTGGSTRGW